MEILETVTERAGTAAKHHVLPSRSEWIVVGVVVVAMAGLLAGCKSTHQPASSSAEAAQQTQAKKSEPTQTEKPVPHSSASPSQRATGPGAAPEGQPGGELTLFDGKTLAGWATTDFGGHGEVRVENGQIIIGMGAALSGIQWTNPIPKTDYEVTLEAMKVEGSDFFCGLTFPVRDAFCSFIVGGWGGGVVGLSSIDSNDASENETTHVMSFEEKRWYQIRLRVTEKKIEAWIDAEKIVDLETMGRQISLRPGEIELSAPFGIATWQTTGALRAVKLRRL
jgi:3-keto-disaccharide hydrolase